MSLALPILIAVTGVVTGGLVRVSSERTYYDYKEGFACLSGKVSVEDPQYQMHADRAYVYFGATNDLKRVVAVGNVAITNGTRRASGSKATYFRDSGVVVLHSGEGVPAEVRDAGEGGDRVIRGKKIRFWTGARQVEVLEAELTAPSGGVGAGVKGILGR